MTPRTSARVRIICDIMGLICLSVTGFLLPWGWAQTGWVGFLLTGIGLFVLNWRLSEDPTRGSS